MVIEIVIILTEMLETPNFGHMTTSTIEFESRNKIFVVDDMDRNYDVITFQNTFVASFADIIKVATIFIKTTFKDS